MSLDLEELPKYVSINEIKEWKGSSEKMTIKVVQFPGQRPVEVTVSPEWTVAEVEAKLAKAWGKNPRTTRLYLGDEALPKEKTFRELSAKVNNQVLQMIPDAPVGAIDLPPTLPFSIPPEWMHETDYNRIYAELVDLPYKPGYKQWFKVTLKSVNTKDLLFPTLHIKFKGKWYPFQLILIGYPNHIRGYFIVPPPSPHVFKWGEVCWDLEKEWKPGMQLYEDFIRFLKDVLEHPRK